MASPARPPQPARRKLIFGPEPWRELARGTWSHWDLWFCTLAITGFDCDWARLGDEIVRRSPRYLVGLDWEAKLSHLEDLRARLAAADLDAAELASEAAHDKKVVARARRKVLDQPLQGGRDLTPAMRATPRERLWCRAMHGHWRPLPGFPSGRARRVRRDGQARTGPWPRRLGHRAGAPALPARPGPPGAGRHPARRLALWRGLLTAGIEALGEVRDSDGELAGFLGESLATYAPATVAAQRDRRAGVLHRPMRTVRVGEPRPALPTGDRPVRQRCRRAP